MKRIVLAVALALGACDELGNPVPGSGTSDTLVRQSETRGGVFVTELRYVAPAAARQTLRSLGDEVDHLDETIPPGHALVLVMVRHRPPAGSAHKPFVHLETRFRYADDRVDARTWVARGNRPRYVALFAVPKMPVDVQTDGF